MKNGFLQTFDRQTNALAHGAIVKSAEWLRGKDSDSVFASVKFESGDFKAVNKYDRNDTQETPGAVGLFGYDWRRGLGQALGSYVNAIYEANVAAGLPLAANEKRPDEVWNSYNTLLDQWNFGHNLRIGCQLSDRFSIKNIVAYRFSRVRATAGLIGADALVIPASVALFYFNFLSVNPSTAGWPEGTRQFLANAEVGKTYCTFCSGPESRSGQPSRVAY